MASVTPSFDSEWSFAAATRTVFGVPFRTQTYRNLCYLALSFPLGVLYFVLFAVGFSLGIAFAIVAVGVPILLATLAVATGLATVERRLATFLLGVDIPTRETATPESLAGRVKSLVTDLGTWKAVVYLGTKLFIGALAFEIVMSLLVTAVSLLMVPFVYDQPGVYVGVVTNAPVTLHPALYFGWDDLLVGVETVIPLSAWRVHTLAEALAVAALGLGLGVLSLHLLNALAWLSGRYTRLMLGERGTAGTDARTRS